MADLKSLSREFYSLVRNDIFEFCKKGFNFSPTWQQAELLEIVQKEARTPLSKRKKRIACKSGQGPGKTTVSVIIGAWRAIQYQNSLTVVTAPTMRQCRQVWLTEFSRLLDKAHPLFRKVFFVYGSEIRLFDSSMWKIITVTSIRPESAQGLHQDRLTFIVEEASGVPRPLIQQIQGTLTNKDALLLEIGNPNTRDCAFFDCFNSQRHLWHTATFNAEESPIVSKENIALLEDEFGRDSDVFRVRVLGEFPHMDPNCIMSSEDLDRCSRTSMTQFVNSQDVIDGVPRRVARQIGIDLARFGDDESAIAVRSGHSIVEFLTFNKTEPADVIKRAFLIQKERGWGDEQVVYVVDASGIGQGVLSIFYSANKRVLEFHNHGVPRNPDYHDKVSEAYFAVRDLVRKTKAHIPKDNRLIKQFSTRLYEVTPKGKIRIEEKKKYKDRDEEGESPDRSDAVAYAFYPYTDLVGNVGQVGARSKDISESHKRKKRLSGGVA